MSGHRTAAPRLALHEPCLRGNGRRYVDECLRTGWVSSVGKFVDRFEAELAAYTGVRHAVACASGTAALHSALLACGIGPGDAVLLPALTFIATANAVRYCGAQPVFIDVEPEHYTLSPAAVEEYLATRCRRTTRGLCLRGTETRVRALLPVHTMGYPARMPELLAIARRYRLRVIEDAAQAIGSRRDGRQAGTFGDAGCLSFNGNKLITTGGGGAILTDDPLLARRLRSLTQQAKVPHPYDYVHDAIGYNYRLNNLQAALGVAQLEQLDGFIARKARIEAWYRRALIAVEGVTMPTVEPGVRWNRWMFAVTLARLRSVAARNRLLDVLHAAGIDARPFWRPANRQAPHRAAPHGPLPATVRIYRCGLHLPSSVSLRLADVRRVAAGLMA